MPQQVLTTVENNFTGGLKTDFTALNFPENACTEVDNCVFSIIGDVSRREGLDYEKNHELIGIPTGSKAISEYKWNNVGGDGETKLLVQQVGATIYFYKSSDATEASPLSTKLLVSAIVITPYATSGDIAATECQFADGNGYLFVFHPHANTFYCTYASGTVSANQINLQIRDFTGVVDGYPVDFRPTTLTNEHKYQILNKGWSSAAAWTATSTTVVTIATGSRAFTIASGLTIVNGTPVTIVGSSSVKNAPTGTVMGGTVTSYAGTTLTINVTTVSTGSSVDTWTISPLNAGLITTWFTAEGNYPSNADIWWRFKNTTGVFDPATTQPNITVGTGLARSGYYILDPFTQNRSAISGVPSLTSLTTTVRPRTGTWFQGRVWYTGVDASQAATGNQRAYTWSENIYFSQIIESVDQFGMCYQVNDPTSEEFPDLLASDGGVISIQGSGKINKLFPIQNGLLVFADNGIWFITGSQGLGFTANDYTPTKISAVQSLSSTSFIDVLGFPIFWNEEGIYTVSPAQQAGGRDNMLTVNNITLGNIGSFYEGIPSASKVYARGDYNRITYTVSWVYRSTTETGISNRYNFDRVLNFNTAIKAFYPFTISTGSTGPHVHDLKYIYNPGGGPLSAPSDAKYTVSDGTYITFAEERDNTHWVDFHSYNSVGYDYDSYFVTGYKLHGKANFKFQPVYIQMFSNSELATAYRIQGIWDYANSPNSGKYSTIQRITNAISRFGYTYRRHRIRGRGVSLQIKVLSVSGLPFHIVGWSTVESTNSNV